jgi:hypothetical protein
MFIQTISLYPLLFFIFLYLNARGAFRVKFYLFLIWHMNKSWATKDFQIIYIKNLLCDIFKKVLPTTTLVRKMFVKIACNRYLFHPKLVWEISNVCITPLVTSKKKFVFMFNNTIFLWCTKDKKFPCNFMWFTKFPNAFKIYSPWLSYCNIFSLFLAHVIL